MTLDDLAQQLARAGLSPAQLRTPLGRIFEAAPRQARAALHQIFDPGAPLCALLDRDHERDRLCRHLTPEQDAALTAALRQILSPPDPSAPRTDFPSSRDALDDWANAHGVAHVLAFSAIELAPQAGWLSDGRAVSIADVFDPAFSAASGRSSHVRPTTVRAFLWEWLQHYSRELDDFRTYPASPAIVDLPFRPFLDRLEAWRAPVLTWFPRLAQEHFNARIELGPHQVIVRMPVAEQTAAGLLRPTVLFPYEAHLPPSCSCRRTHCWHGSAAIDALARWLQAAPSFYRHSLQRSLRPGHEKLFEALAAAPPPPPAPVLTRVGFRIDLNKLAGVDPHQAIEAIAEAGKGKPRTLKAREALRGAALLSAKDRRSLERLAELQRDRGTPSTQAELLRGLIGHPGVLLREHRRDLAVEVRAAPVQIEVVERPGGLEARLRLNGAPLGTHFASCWVQGDAGALRFEPDPEAKILWLGELPASAWSFVKALGQFGGSFPTHVAPQLMKTLEGLGPVALALPPSLQGAAVPPDERLRVRVVPGHGLCLSLSLSVEPLAGELPQLPGEGLAALSSWRSFGRVHTTRDLAGERAAAAKLIAQLGLPAATDAREALWELEDPERVLDVLEQLHRLGDAVVIQTVGAALRVTRPLACADLRLNVRKRADWFALEGTARVGEATIPVARVLEAIRGGIRWVDLGNQQFARLSQQLVAQLAPVALSSRARGDATEVTLADAPAIDALEGQVEALHLAEGFARILERMRAAKELKVKLPRNFKATLRDYQAEGFRWLSRLAAWGAGAVLAD
ncbi:MAG: snf2/helicase protein, partial [Myxococcaceae bacterium]|nr:snf2/helicase protein [Myxococcaceae bacterium]